MALNATIFKANLQVSDMDRGHYHSYDLTLALHPSETEERMMVRLLVFALLAGSESDAERINFTKGISTDDEPELWQKSLQDEILWWIELGQPDEKRIRKACGRSKKVMIVNFNDKSQIWWDQIRTKMMRFQQLAVLNLPEQQCKGLVPFCQKSMQLTVNIQDGEVWLSNHSETLHLTPSYRINPFQD